MTSAFCAGCGGLGWLLLNNDLHGLRVERCDNCKALLSDDAAAVAAYPLLEATVNVARRRHARRVRAECRGALPPDAKRHSGGCCKASSRHCLGGDDEPGQRVRVSQCRRCGEDVCRFCSGRRLYRGQTERLCNECWSDAATTPGERVAREVRITQQEYRYNGEPRPSVDAVLLRHFSEEDREHYESARRRPAAPAAVGRRRVVRPAQ